MADEGRNMDRSVSPTRKLYEMREQASKKLWHMAQLGLHVFNPDWNKQGWTVKDGDVTAASHYHSSSFKDCTLKLKETGETMTIPVQVCTKVWDLKCALANAALTSPEGITFVMKQGCSWRVQVDTEEVHRSIVVRGIKSFSPQPHKWPHPTVILGAGYNGLKTALLWATEGDRDFINFDRYDRVGGHAWLVQANKTSKLQTEHAAFCVWWGPQWGAGNDKLGYPTEWSTWPKKDEVVATFQHCAERYDLLPHISFRHECKDMQIVGKISDFERYYILTIEPMGRPDLQKQIHTNVLYHFPGAYFNPRIINYPGEEESGIEIGYGMNDDLPYDYIDSNRVAILGNGAFAVENIRTCVEYNCQKVYLITRKKNLPSPRLPCWFVHQSIIPVPAKMLLNLFIPMFDQGGFGDPWQYHSVFASKDRQSCTIVSNSRFGIGDVTFLAVAWGRCEYIQDLLKRCTKHTLHLVGGRKVENIHVIIKALGLIADFTADKFHKLKEMVGTWPAGDFRRVLFCDPLGMHAANFAAFSTGVGSYVASVRDKYLINFPQEYGRLHDEGLVELLPKTKATEEKPAHQYDAKHATSVSMIVDSNLPRMQMKLAGMDSYFHVMCWEVNPFHRVYEECVASWNQYQIDWWKQGHEHEYTPYPYSKDMIAAWFDEYAVKVGPVKIDERTPVPSLNGKELPPYIPSWEAEDGQPGKPVEVEKGGDCDLAKSTWAPRREDFRPAPGPVLASGAKPRVEEKAKAEEKAAPAAQASQENSEKEPDYCPVDQLNGELFGQVPWDQGGSWEWWASFQTRTQQYG